MQSAGYLPGTPLNGIYGIYVVTHLVPGESQQVGTVIIIPIL